MPRISVLMGIYNGRRVDTARAIDSILEQTFADFEFIICDDGSEERFAGWLKKYCRKDKRIRLIRNKRNRGLAASLNRCFTTASGSYIARMDADDVAHRERFAKQYDFLESHLQIAAVGCSVRMFDDHGIWGIRNLPLQPNKNSFLKTLPFVHPSIMLRREVFLHLHGYREVSWVQRAEDYDFFMRMYALGYQGYNLRELLLDYREDQDSYKKRKYRYRIHECFVRGSGFFILGILMGNIRYVIKPLLVGLIPGSLMRAVRMRRYAFERKVELYND